jgi:hypothetical protein
MSLLSAAVRNPFNQNELVAVRIPDVESELPNPYRIPFRESEPLWRRNPHEESKSSVARNPVLHNEST